ncbi:actin-related protein 8 [Artemisia annua]|uniref:Actin-related protein 8 n=1 Tax=Artemisia annua TaxID=35608 RepID=A0A2U1LV23_ARTAN|nr:actin-related protein 8 [Artemisia annua]
MSHIFKKILDNISTHRTNSNKHNNIANMNSNHASSSSSLSINNHDDDHDHMMMMMSYGSTGEFDKIPVDVFMQIVKLLEPKEVAKLTGVCKTWKVLASDNKLWVYYLQTQKLVPWDAIFFSEISLRSGFPLQTFPSQRQSFMSIYGQRSQVPGAIIIDGGSGYCKFGWSKFDSPSGRSATFLEFGNIESPMYSRLRHFFATIYSRMQVKSSTQPIIVSIPITQYDDTEAAKAARRQLKEAIYSALFGMNVPAVCAVSQATLALFAAKKTSGIVVNIGFHQTSVVPILHGKIMRKVGVESVGVGALKLTGYLREQMQQRNLHFDSLYTVRSLKENLCYVALDYEAELCKDTEASYEVAAAGRFTLKRERFQTGEVLFQPRIAGMRAMGLHQAVALCIDHCHDAELTTDESWYKTVVLAGGTACLPGVAERLEKELHDLLHPSIAAGIKVIAPPYGADSAWYGAKLISNLSTFPNSWCITKKEFRSKARRNPIW